MTNKSQLERQEMLDYLAELGSQIQDENHGRLLAKIANFISEKRYGLMWEEHTEHVDEMLVDNVPVFVDVPEKTITANESQAYNFLLEGDNLHSLLLLQKTHKGKIDVIYIDPPYNTGNKDFTYSDDYVQKNDGFAHSKWLSFMQRRLELAQQLLSQDGLIFISIDDKEQAQLKLLCDQIFGEHNFIETFCWNKTTTPPSLSQKTRSDIDFIHLYQKSDSPKELNSFKEDIKSTDSPIENKGNPIGTITFPAHSVICKIPDGIYSSDLYGNGKLLDNLVVENGTNQEPFRYRTNLKWSQEYLNQELALGTEIFIKTPQISIRYKKSSSRQKVMSPNKLIDAKFKVGTNDEAQSEIKTLGLNFTYPKPTSLIKFLVRMNQNQNSTVLDFFAGSGTTGHAVAQINQEDGGNRTYILCTNNENNICEEVTYQRLSKIQAELPHNLKYFQTDFVPYESEDQSLLELTLAHTKELIELENHRPVDGVNIGLLEFEEDFDEVVANLAQNSLLYVAQDLLLSHEQKYQLSSKNVQVINVPSHFYRRELVRVHEM